MSSQRIAAIKSRRTGEIDDYAAKCCDLINPQWSAGFAMKTAGQSTIASRMVENYSSVPQEAIRELAAATASGIAPASTRWLDLDVAEMPDYRHKWLDDAANTIWRELHAGGFDSILVDYLSIVFTGGWSITYTDYAKDIGTLTHEIWPAGACWIDETHNNRGVNVIVREVQLTAQQIVNQYVERGDKVPTHIKTAAKQDSKQTYTVCQIIEPRRDGMPGGPKNRLPFASRHYIGNDLIRDSGYEEMPVAVARWRKNISDPYATGLVFDALPAIRVLNEMTKNKMLAVEMAAVGMWGVADDGVINPKNIKIGPKKVLPMRDNQSMWPLTPGGNANLAMTELQIQEQAVRRALLADKLALPQTGNTTATEINVRLEMLRQLLGPVFGRLQQELLQPLITRCFGLLSRNGKIPPPPDELNGATINVRFVSPLARSQRLGEVNAMRQMMQDVMLMAQAKPETLDKIDFDKIVDEESWALGVPMAIIRDDKAVKRLRDARAEQQRQQAEQMQQQAIAAQGVGQNGA